MHINHEMGGRGCCIYREEFIEDKDELICHLLSVCVLLRTFIVRSSNIRVLFVRQYTMSSNVHGGKIDRSQWEL
jgi:hypothetical protein